MIDRDKKGEQAIDTVKRLLAFFDSDGMQILKCKEDHFYVIGERGFLCEFYVTVLCNSNNNWGIGRMNVGSINYRGKRKALCVSYTTVHFIFLSSQVC